MFLHNISIIVTICADNLAKEDFVLNSIFYNKTSGNHNELLLVPKNFTELLIFSSTEFSMVASCIIEIFYTEG